MLDKDIAAYRNAVDADIVVAMAAGTYPTAYGSSTLEVEDSNRAHAIVEIDAPANNYTLAHEVVQVLNCRHDPMYDLGGPAHAHGYRFEYYGQEYRTLMGVVDGIRVAFVSDPDYAIYHQPAGVEGLSDNVRQLHTEAKRVCSYRGGQCNPDLSITFNGPYQGQSGQTYTWCATVDYCDNTVGYYWEKSTDGINYSYAGTSQCVSLPMPQNRNLWLRLRASCVGKEDKVAFYQVLNSSVVCKLCRNSWEEAMETPTALHVFPNPNKGTFMVDLSSFGDGEKSLALYTVTGQRVWEGATQENGVWSFAPTIPAGLYTLQVRQGEMAQQTLLRVER